QVLEADNRDLAQAQPPCRMDAAVAGEDVALVISQDWNIEPKHLNAAGDLLDLPVAMAPRIAGIKLEPLDRDALDPKFANHPSLAYRHPTPPVGRPTEFVP